MPKGYSLHIGVNIVDQRHYLGLTELKAAVQDAKDYLQIAKEIFGYQDSQIFLNEQATTQNVKTSLHQLSEKVEPGDILFISYSGHGGLVEDPNFKLKGDEPYDQTWCLFDRQLLDDELFEAFKKFKDGTRLLVISDSCHSGSVTRAVPGISDSKIARQAKEADFFSKNIEVYMQANGLRSKEVPEALASRINEKNAAVYSSLQDQFKRVRKKSGLGASVKLFAACQDNQITFDGDENGRFTEAIKKIILGKEWQQLDNSQRFIDALRAEYAFPTPNYFQYGRTDLAFDHNFPLLIDLVAPVGENIAPIVSSTMEIADKMIPLPNAPILPSSNHKVQKIHLSFPTDHLLKELVLKICPEPIKMLKPGKGPKANTCLAYFDQEAFPVTWALVHHIAQKADHYGIDVEVEPSDLDNFPTEEEFKGSKAAGKGFEYMDLWPPITTQGPLDLGWHLGEEYSQLGPARDSLWGEIRTKEITSEVRMAHIDTGWWPDHPALAPNPNIMVNLARSFIDGEEYSNGDAVDIDQTSGMEQQDHGIGTLGIVSGWEVDPALTYGKAIGFIGAAPFIKTIPIRVTESVIILNPTNIAEAIDYAIKMGCEVITMSLGGKPNKQLAAAVNRAYEAGVTFVSAAGNSMVKGMAKLGPRTLIYPARYDRVIAACGVAQNHYPYDFEAQKMDPELKAKSMSTDFMQGNWGPHKYMHQAIAAYTPNVPWLAINEAHPIKKNGGGTSSATPQVASAAALWILKNKEALAEKGYAGTWQQVEAVRHALYSSAKPGPFEHWEKYYGQGIIQAKDALEVPVPSAEQLSKAKEAKSTLMGAAELMKLLLGRKRSTSEAMGKNVMASLQSELEYLLFHSEKGQELLDQIEEGSLSIQDQKVQEYILQSNMASEPLKEFMAVME